MTSILSRSDHNLPDRNTSAENPPDRPASTAENEAVTRIAQRIVDSGLVTPAVFFLAMVKPFSLLSSHALVFFGPILTAFIRADRYYRATELIEDPENVEFLITEIERLDEALKSKPKPKR